MEFPETVKKGFSKARGEIKRFAEGMASDRNYFGTDNTRTYQRTFYTREIRYNLVSPVDILRYHIPMASQPGNNGSYSDRERWRIQQAEASKMQGIEINGAPYPEDDPRAESFHHQDGPQGRLHWVPDEQGDVYVEGRAGRLVLVPDEPEEVFEDAPQDPNRSVPKEGSHHGRTEGASEGASVIPTDPTKSGSFYNHPSATVDHASDIQQMDAQYLNLNLNKREPSDQQDVPTERTPSIPPRGPSLTELRELQEQNTTLLERARILQNTLDHQTRESNREKNELKGKLGQYIRKTQQLNQIIIKNANQTNEPSDTEIERATTEISSDITRIIRTHYAGSQLLVDYSKAKQYKEETFYKPFKHYRAETIRRLLSQRLFQSLHTGIFAAKTFGVNSDAEFHLEQFERAITASTKISKQDAVDWRVRTVSCAGQLELDQRDRIDHISKWIWQRFCPMVLSGPKKNTSDGINDIMMALRELVEKCLKLALKFRATETSYSFLIPSETALLGNYPEGHYQIMGSEGELSKEAEEDEKRQRVFCVLFGALLKTKMATAGEEEKTVVLFPAQIVTYEDRDRDARDRDLREQREQRDQRDQRDQREPREYRRRP